MQEFSDEGDEEDDEDAESIKASTLVLCCDEESTSRNKPELAARISPSGLRSRRVPSTLLFHLDLYCGPRTPEAGTYGDIYSNREVGAHAARLACGILVLLYSTSLLGYKAVGTRTQHFQYIAPHSASPAAPVTPTHSAPPSLSVVRE